MMLPGWAMVCWQVRGPGSGYVMVVPDVRGREVARPGGQLQGARRGAGPGVWARLRPQLRLTL